MNIDLLSKVTEDGKYAGEICLYFTLSEQEHFLEQFDKLNIIGKKLETFVNDCCDNCNIDMIRTVLLCIDWGLFDINLVHKNLEQANPIPFIDKLFSDEHEGMIQRYERYKDTFNKNMQRGKNR